MNFDQLFELVFRKFWYHSIRKALKNVFMLGAKIKKNFEKFLHDPLYKKVSHILIRILVLEHR